MFPLQRKDESEGMEVVDGGWMAFLMQETKVCDPPQSCKLY